MKTYTTYYDNLNEGFWSWLSGLFKVLFGDDTTEETKEYTKQALSDIAKTHKEMNEPTTELLQKLNKEKADEFLKQLNEIVDKSVEDKVLTEDEAVKYKLTVLSIAIRISNDSKKEDVVKVLKKEFDELAKKHPDLAKALAKEIKKIEVPEKENKEQKSKLDEKVLSVYNAHKDVINEICNSDKVKIKTEDIEKEISEYCVKNKIEDANVFYGLVLLKLGKAVSKDESKTNEYIESICTKISSK